MSISSSMMTSVTTWRNQDNKANLPSFKKVVISELAFAALAVAAVVESAANAVFLIATLPCILIDNKPAKLAIDRLGSSALSAVWAGANLIANLVYANLITKEEAVRSLASQFSKKLA